MDKWAPDWKPWGWSCCGCRRWRCPRLQSRQPRWESWRRLRRRSALGSCLGSRTLWRSGLGCRWWTPLVGRLRQRHWGTRDACRIMCVKVVIRVDYHLEQENLTRTLPCMSKMTTLITLHSTTTILPHGSTATPRGCWRTSAPNFLTNWPYLLNIWTCAIHLNEQGQQDSSNLVCWRSLGHHDIATGCHHSHTVGVQELAVTLSNLD